MQSDITEVASVAEESSASAEQVSASTQQTSASTQEIAASARAREHRRAARQPGRPLHGRVGHAVSEGPAEGPSDRCHSGDNA